VVCLYIQRGRLSPPTFFRRLSMVLSSLRSSLLYALDWLQGVRPATSAAAGCTSEKPTVRASAAAANAGASETPSCFCAMQLTTARRDEATGRAAGACVWGRGSPGEQGDQSEVSVKSVTQQLNVGDPLAFMPSHNHWRSGLLLLLLLRATHEPLPPSAYNYCAWI